MNRILFSSPDSSLVKQFFLGDEISGEKFRSIGGVAICRFNANEASRFYESTEKPLLNESDCSENSILESSNEEGEIRRYSRALKQAIVDVENDLLSKVVVSRRIRLEGVLNTLSVFKQLVDKHKSAFVYLLDLNGVTYIGATPELLISKKGEKVQSDSLAGTKETKAIQNGTQGWQAKELIEHSIVTDSVKLVYDKYCESVEVSEREDRVAGRISHLYQQISGKLNKESDFLELVSELHPTPAVAGSPVPDAIQWIETNEGYDRDLYTGYLGVSDGNETNLYVNLRNLKYQNNITTLYVGGGIVKGSKFESELEETQHKAETLLSSIRAHHNIN